METVFLFFFQLLFTSFVGFSLAMSTTTAMAKDQIACTMCSSCDNPCQPISSPPPPPLPPPSPPPPSGPNFPPPPSPPPPTGPNCPPPPSPPCGVGCSYYSPPPPAQQSYYPPPYGGGGATAPSNSDAYVIPPPPEPTISNFPFYSHSPPLPAADSDYYSHSVQLKSHPFISSLFIVFSIIFFL